MSSLRNYEIRQKLGSGSYGVIYKAYNKIDKSVCVLKQISLTRMSEKARKNAVNQAHIMGKLKHPFIVCYYDSFIEDSNLNILMEFCEGGDLCYLLKQQNKKYLKEEKIWKFFIQICMGLEHIHKNKILHRDIKTLNIFLNKNENVKIGDLGVAKMLNSNDFAHTMVGTPFYLSPQLCEQKPYNQKSDIWAMGCLLYQLCTFRHPFEAANQASLILKIIRGKYEPIPQFYSKQLTQMINQCLERDYKRRPTAAMILSKPNIKKMMEEFELNKIVQQFYSKPTIQPSLQPPPPATKPEAKVIENKPVVNRVQIKPAAQKPKKVLDDVPIVKQPVKIQEPKVEVKNPIKQQKKQKKIQNNQNQLDNPFSKKRESQPALQKDEKPKILFGSENKADFISALESKIKSPPKRVVQVQKVQVVKKNPISFEIPWKGDSNKRNISQSNHNQEDQGKVIVHNKNILLSQPSIPIQKNSEVINRIKVEKKVESKVYEMIKQNQKPQAIIKSAGFSQGQRPQTGFDRKKQQDVRTDKKSVQMPSKPVQQPKKVQNQVVNSMKNIRKSSEQRPTYIIQKQPQNQNQLPHYPPRFKKPSINQQQKSKIPKHLPHQSKSTSTSASRFTEVTKEQEDLVANLPDKVKRKLQQSYIEQTYNQKQNSSKIRFKQIDDQVVLKMYEEMMKSSQSKIQHKKENDALIDQNGDNIQQIIQQNPSIVKEDLQNQVEQDDVNNNSEMYYQVNKYQTEEMDYPSKTINNQQLSHEWSFDQEPQLPMLEQTQTPLFEEANPYLVQQMQETESKSQEEILEDKKEHLQIKLKENMKREDQINRLMQMKIEQCRAVVPKNFDEILIFFRSKINMDRQYTEQDDKQVQSFLARRNLTDQRKFQNIYKIMHFEMQLENTRRIIQSICKKLNQLQKQKNNSP